MKKLAIAFVLLLAALSLGFYLGVLAGAVFGAWASWFLVGVFIAQAAGIVAWALGLIGPEK